MTDKTTAEIILESIEWLLSKQIERAKNSALQVVSRAESFDGVNSFTVDALMSAAAETKVWTLIQFELDSNAETSTEDKLRSVFNLCRRNLLSHWATQSTSWSAAALRDLELQEYANILRTFEASAELDKSGS